MWFKIVFPAFCREYAGLEGRYMTKFQQGVSGNPKGKKAGTLNKRTALVKYFDAHAEQLINKTVELALSGDTVALRLCVERLVPKITDRPATIVMPDLAALETSKIIPELLRSLAGQEISVSEFKNLIDIFTAHDDEIHRANKRHEKLEITTKDPIEAARQYQQIMQRSHA